MLVMSGDQIYADDVAGPMLRAIHSVIETLGLQSEGLSGMEVDALQDECDLYRHKDCYYRRMHILPNMEGNRALLDTLFEGARRPIFTTDTAQNHLITLHEHLIMYLMVWSPIPWQLASMAMPANMSEREQTLYQKERRVIEGFVVRLSQVRRLLAHIPVAMIFDDHDITDDWNLNRQREEVVYNHPFSRRIIGNGLIAYFLCQGWGNNPDGFSAEMMEQLSAAIESPGQQPHAAFVEEMLTFQGWEYDWKTSPPLIVIDSRTRRWRSESSMIKPSGLLDWEALTDLQPKLYHNDSVLLVSPAPIYGVLN